MRIISGKARGRRLFSPGHTNRPAKIRPTSDRVREAIFNIIGKAVIDSDVLDLFAGTGALGLEALSRGGLSATFVDNNQQAIRLINKNLDCCGFAKRSTVLYRNLLKSTAFLNKITPESGFDLIFVDPPYRRDIAAETLEQVGMYNILADNGWLIVEEDSGVDLPQDSNGLEMIDRRIYGDTTVCFYQKVKVSQDE